MEQRLVPNAGWLLVTMACAGTCLVLSVATAFQPLIGLVLLAALTLGLWALYDPLHPLLFAFFLIPFDKMTVLFPPKAAGTGSMTLLSSLTVPKLIILVTLGGWIVEALLRKGKAPIKQVSSSILPLTVCAFFAITLVSVLEAQSKGLFLFVEMRLLNLVTMFFLLIGLIDRKVFLERMLLLLLVAYVPVGIMGLYELATQTHILELWGYPLRSVPYTLTSDEFRAVATYGDPDMFSRSMVFASLIAMFFLTRVRSGTVKVLLCGTLLLFFVNILASGSRAALLGYLGAATCFWYFATARLKWWIAGGAMGAMGVALAAYTLIISATPFERYVGEKGKASLAYRIGWAKMGIAMVIDHPVLGVGSGNFLEQYNRYLVPSVPRSPYYMHNTFLEVWVENGTIGFIAYVLLYALSLWNLYKAYRDCRDPTLRVVAVLFLSLIVGLGFAAATCNVLTDELYWMVFGFSFIIRRLSEEGLKRGLATG